MSRGKIQGWFAGWNCFFHAFFCREKRGKTGGFWMCRSPEHSRPGTLRWEEGKNGENRWEIAGKSLENREKPADFGAWWIPFPARGSSRKKTALEPPSAGIPGRFGRGEKPLFPPVFPSGMSVPHLTGFAFKSSQSRSAFPWDDGLGAGIPPRRSSGRAWEAPGAREKGGKGVRTSR